VLLDSAASGWNTVEREGISISHPARFILVGSGAAAGAAGGGLAQGEAARAARGQQPRQPCALPKASPRVGAPARGPSPDTPTPRPLVFRPGNPEEGELRPQLLDRFGMHAQVRGRRRAGPGARGPGAVGTGGRSQGAFSRLARPRKQA
jgi:hypothetical protein